MLLGFVLGAGKEDLYAHPEPSVSPEALARYETLVARRARGEPVAYLRGLKEFYGLELAVDPRVLIPRPESELLVEEAARRVASHPAPLVCELGTGSGAIAIALAVSIRRARIIASDSSAEAVDVARRNARRHRVTDRIAFRVGDLFDPVPERLDALVANLPYLTTAQVDACDGTSLAFEPRAALDGGLDGLDVIRRAARDLPAHLSEDGSALFECAPTQTPAVAAVLGRVLGRVEIVRDLAGDERVVVGSTLLAPRD